MWSATLQEAPAAEDEMTTYPNPTPNFFAYSVSGNAQAEYLYVSYGQQANFDRLKELNISPEGRIALAKNGSNFPGIKVNNAQENGMIGVIIYTDTGDDGEVTEANGYEPIPTDQPEIQPISNAAQSSISLSPPRVIQPHRDIPRKQTHHVRLFLALSQIFHRSPCLLKMLSL